MDISRHPELLDRLAAAYALGLLRHGARRRFEQMARDQVAVRAAALLWQERWSALAELQAPVRPDDAVWARIERQLRQQKARPPAHAPAERAPGRHAGWQGGWHALAWWRGAAVLGACASVAAVAVGLWSHQSLEQDSARQLADLRGRLQAAQAAPAARYVAVLADGRAEPALLVTFDPGPGALVLQRVGGFQEPADKSLQLWALPRQGGPHSLGVLGRGGLQHLAAAAAEVENAPALAVSLEPLGGVPGEAGPTGPVLFKGALIRREL